MLVETTDFEDYPYNLAFDQRDKRETKLCQAIDLKEPEWMRYALGDNFYVLFRDGLDEGTPDQRWIDLRDGKEWTYNDKTVIYDGIRPLIRPYIYYYYTRSEHTITTLQGEQKAKSEHSDAVTPGYKISEHWMSMIEGIKALNCFLENSGDYPEFDICDTKQEYLLRLPNVLNI